MKFNENTMEIKESHAHLLKPIEIQQKSKKIMKTYENIKEMTENQ